MIRRPPPSLLPLTLSRLLVPLGLPPPTPFLLHTQVRSRCVFYSLSTWTQIGVKLGNRLVFMHILKRQTNILWKWGPVTQYMIDLTGVDSAGPQKGGDVMELVGLLDASDATRELLLDSVMNGFVYSLFDLKWKRYSAKLHWALLSCDLAYVFPLMMLCFIIKSQPNLAGSPLGFWMPEIVLATGFFALVPDLATIPFWWDAHGWWKYQGPNWRRKLFVELIQWFQGLGVHLKFASVFFATIACLTLMGEHPTAGKNISGRMLLRGAVRSKSRNGVMGAYDPCRVIEFDEVDPNEVDETGDYIWLCLGFAVFWQMFFVMNTLLMPFKKLGILVLTVNRMLKDDITVFMIPFVIIMMSFYTLLYTIYPRAGDTLLPQAPAFNDWSSGLESLIKLAFLGESLDVYLTKEAFLALMPAQRLNYVVFIVFYLFYILLGMVLLLNLLIAMLSNTFATVAAQADLEWRLERVRRVLRLELIAKEPFYKNTDLRIGEQQGDKFFVPFRGANPNQEGIEVEGGKDLFIDISPFDYRIRLPQLEDLEEDPDDVAMGKPPKPKPALPPAPSLTPAAAPAPSPAPASDPPSPPPSPPEQAMPSRER